LSNFYFRCAQHHGRPLRPHVSLLFVGKLTRNYATPYYPDSVPIIVKHKPGAVNRCATKCVSGNKHGCAALQADAFPKNYFEPTRRRLVCILLAFNAESTHDSRW